MNLDDPILEWIEPTPDIQSLFLNFDKLFFCTKLTSKTVVKWDKRMYSTPGLCSFDVEGDRCVIEISEPLLKLRPRKDLVEALLHEMIHAFLFVTERERDRDIHGPIFRAHMHRINQTAGLNIDIYHNFNDETRQKTPATITSSAAITKYIDNNNNTTKDKNTNRRSMIIQTIPKDSCKLTPIQKSSNNISVPSINSGKKRSNSVDMGETLRKKKNPGKSKELERYHLVNCPVCGSKIDKNDINKHLDECLSKSVVQELSQSTSRMKPASSVLTLKIQIEDPKAEIETKQPHSNSNVSIDLTNIQSGNVSVILDKKTQKISFTPTKIESGTSKNVVLPIKVHSCACCGKKVEKPMVEHLDECSFFDINKTVPEERPSTSLDNNTILIDDEYDDILMSVTMTDAETWTQCPCCMKMIGTDALNRHLDDCLILF